MKKVNLDSKVIKIHFDDSKKEIEVMDGGVVYVSLFGTVTLPTTGRGEYIAMEPFQVRAGAYAKPTEGDPYNVEIGIKVATAKAENNIYRRAIKRMEEEYQKAWYFTNAFCDFYDKTVSIEKHNKKYIKRISKVKK